MLQLCMDYATALYGETHVFKKKKFHFEDFVWENLSKQAEMNTIATSAYR